MDIFSPINIAIFLIDVALAVHVIRSGRNPIWIVAMGATFFLGSFQFLGLLAVWLSYFFTAVIPDFFGSHGMRRFRSGIRDAADPGRAYRQAKRDAERIGSTDSKRVLAEESLKRGLCADAIRLYEEAMQGPLGAEDPTLLKGLGRAKLMAGEAGEAERLFIKVHELDPAAFDTEVELDYARALEALGKNDAAIRQYESVVPRYSGEEAKVRLALLLEKSGQEARAQQIFRDVVETTRDAPGYYRSRQGDWLKIAKQHLKS
ncbi:MAG: hypothetical protein JO256_06040 [Alphaproteobacteria bacterium]|nr:hypothetical protein [Alphaproteobacteria bacterium]